MKDQCLFLTLDQEKGQVLKGLGPLAKGIQRIATRSDKSVGLAEGLLHAKERRIGCFFRRRVFPRSLAQLFRRLGHIEYVIHNLEGEPDGSSKIAQTLDFRG